MNKAYHYFCQQIVSCTGSISIITLLPESEPMLYMPGQYVEVPLDNGALLALSIANIPNSNGHLEFHLRHDANHPLAQQFILELNRKKKIQLYGPKGKCTLSRANNASSLVFVAGGTGFGPIQALLEDAFYKEKYSNPIKLYWGIRKPEDAYKHTLLQQWQQEFKSFSYETVLSTTEDFLSWRGPRGFVHEHIAHNYPIFNKECVFISGPYPMIKAAFSLFCQQGLTPERFISDVL